MTITELRQQYETKNKALIELLGKGDAATVEELKSAAALDTELTALTSDIKTVNDIEALKSRSATYNDFLNKPAGTVAQSGSADAGGGGGTAEVKREVPAEVRAKHYGGALKSFTKDNGFDNTRAELEYKAYRFGMWMIGVRQSDNGYHDTKEQKWCKEHGLALDWQNEDGAPAVKAQVEGINSAGGFLVPEELSHDLIVLREQFGVARQAMKIVPMASDTKRVARQTGTFTTYFVDEETTITESSLAFDTVLLTARKLGALGTWSSEIGEDSIIDIGDKLAFDIGYAFAAAEDDCAFNGDGTSTYGGMTGFRKKIINLSGTIANIAGALVQTGTGAFSSTLADYQKLVGILPEYADGPNVHWICHRTFWSQTMSVAELAAGGVTSTEVIGGVRQRTFLGYPVLVSQKMPKTYVANDVPVLFGNFGLAGKFGDRRAMTIATSEHVNFVKDSLTIRGTERIDIVVHDIGNQSATAGLRVAGPVVALFTGTS